MTVHGEVILKKGKERAVILGHHWIFSGAIARAEAEDGAVIRILSHSGEILGCGYYNSRSQIRVRVLSFGATQFDDASLLHLIQSSINRRAKNPLLSRTDAVRMIFSEGDFIPGCIVDKYENHLVIQCLTLGTDVMKAQIVSHLLDLLKPESIYERSDHPGRKIEGLTEHREQIFGNTPDELIISENGIRFPIDPKRGQKTGFFIDQRENRDLIRTFASGRKVLNLFSYSGGFTFAAINGGAVSTTSVDISQDALDLARKTYSLNGYATPSEFVCADVFEYLRNNSFDSDLVILDPPAFAKRRDDVDRACRGYKDINLQVFRKAPAGSYLLTCSCSRFIDPDLFQKVIFSGAVDAGRKVQIIRRTGHPADHPVNIAVPETEYLKGLLLLID